MLTTRELCEKAAEEFNLDPGRVERLFNAWVNGTKDRLIEEPIVHFNLSKGVTMFFTIFQPTVKGRDYINRSDILKKSVTEKRKVIKEVDKRLYRKYIPRKAKNNKFRQRIPLYYYGLDKGYTLQELERMQNKVFNEYNKYEYKKNKVYY